MTLNEINSEWLSTMITTLTKQDAAIIFCFGLTKDKKVKVCATNDLHPLELIKQLEGIVKNMKELHK